MRLNKFIQAINKELDHEIEGLFWQCYKTTPKLTNGNDDVNLSNFKVTFNLQLAKDIIEQLYGPTKINVWVTSEENSFGLAEERWFDGAIQQPALSFDNHDAEENEELPGYYFYKKHIKIVSITEYQNLMSKCSTMDYYKCLATRFTHSSTHKKCSLNNTCHPFTLPKLNREVPVCKTNKERKCLEEAVLKLEEDQETHCKKSCIVKEFQTEIPKENIFMVGDEDIMAMGFQYCFGRLLGIYAV